MPRNKTSKQSTKRRRRTLKHRKHKRGGSADSQALIPPTPAFQVSVPNPSNKIV